MEPFLLPILLLVIFYFILIRPQQKQRREIAELQSTLVPGARVMTGSGLIGTIVSIEDDEVVLEVAPGITNRYVRRAIMRVVPDETAEEAGTAPGAGPDLTEPVPEPISDETASRPGADRATRDDAPGTSP